jgi:hypothetical protein
MMKFLMAFLCVMVLCGCRLKATLDKKPAKDKDKQEVAAPEPAPEPPPKVDARPNDGKGIIGKMTQDVLDFQKAKAENPNLIEVNPKAKGDYLSFMASAYINVRAQLSMMQMQKELQLFKATKERNPSYDEIMKIIKQYQVEFTMLPRYQKYAYDAKEGRFTILEDPALRPTE